METHPQLTALPGRQKAMGEKGKRRKGFIKTRGNDGGKKKKNGSFKSMSWVMKIQELPVLAFITKLFLEGKAGINLVFEAWGVWGPVVCFTCWFPSAFWGKQRRGKAGKKPKCLVLTANF